MIRSPQLEDVLARACQRAIARRQAICDSEQVLETLLIELGEPAAADEVARHLDSLTRLSFHPATVSFGRRFRERALPVAERLTGEEGAAEVEPRHLLTALLGATSPVPAAVREPVVRALRRSRSQARSGAAAGESVRPDGSSKAGARAAGAHQETAGKLGGRSPQAPHAGEARKGQPAPAPHLEPAANGEPGAASARDLLAPFAEGPSHAHLVDRPALTDRLLQTLLFGSPLLVGPVGSGRRSLIRLLARRLAAGDVPPALAGTELLELDPTRLLAGTSYRGELEGRVEAVLADLARREKCVLVLENLTLLVNAGGAQGAFDIASALVPRLKSGQVRLVSCATQDELREKLEPHAGLLDQLTPVPVDPPEPAEAVRLLALLPEQLARRHQIRIEPGAERRAVQRCVQHLPHRSLPGEAVRVLEAAAANLAFEEAMCSRDPARIAQPYWRIVGAPAADAPSVLGERHVLHAISQLHRIPFDHLHGGVAEKLRGLDQSFREGLFGQDHVLEVVLRTLKVALTTLSDPRRPRGRLFFLGPPGTGKTECARLLARFLMGSESALLRFDMSDYQEPSAVATLFGSDKGLVGSEEGGQLTEPLRANPHRVVLFDEIEKAHPHVFNQLLQILDNGEVRDRRGAMVSFRHALLIFTSNAGCSGRDGLFGLDRDAIVARLGSTFRPEFLDRIEDFVPFRALDREARREVARLQLEQLRAQLKEAHARDLTWDDALLDAASAPRENLAGVRDLLRWAQRDVKPAVADALIADPSPGTPVRIGLSPEGRVVAMAQANTSAARDDGAATTAPDDALPSRVAAAP